MVWIQYTLTDGLQQATDNERVDDTLLAIQGRAQIFLDDGLDSDGYNVDVSQDPPVLIPPNNS